MEVKLRQRIIGAVVLVALTIIFLPLLFKNSTATSTDSKPLTLTAQIPPAPAKPTPAPQTIVMIKNKDLTTPDVNTNASSTVNTPATAISTLDSNNKPIVKAVQINSPATADNNMSGKNINLIEDETLSPPGNEKNTTNAQNKISHTTKKITKPAQTHIKIVHANVKSVKSVNAHEKAAGEKHIATTGKQTVVSSSLKKNPTLTHHAKATNTTIKPTTATHVKNTTVIKSDKKIIASSTNLAVATQQNTKTLAGSAWEVRLGSFANQANVKDLVKQLRAHGFKAYTQSIQSSLGALTRVAIGPEIKRDKADAMQTRLAKELNIKSEVVPFNPVPDSK